VFARLVVGIGLVADAVRLHDVSLPPGGRWRGASRDGRSPRVHYPTARFMFALAPPPLRGAPSRREPFVRAVRFAQNVPFEVIVRFRRATNGRPYGCVRSPQKNIKFNEYFPPFRQNYQ